MKPFARSLCLALLLAAGAEAGPPPAWYLEHVEHLTAASGTWIASNEAYRSDAEPYAAYRLDWTVIAGGNAARGVLSGVRDDGSLRPFWDFTMFWHTGEHRARVQQISANGTFGTGTLHPVGGERVSLVQQFFAPDGSVTTVGHETTHAGDEQDGWSYDVADDGSWLPRRHYVWHRQSGT